MSDLTPSIFSDLSNASNRYVIVKGGARHISCICRAFLCDKSCSAVEVLTAGAPQPRVVCIFPPPTMFHNILNSQFYGGEYTNVEGNLNFQPNQTNLNYIAQQQLVISDTGARKQEGASPVGFVPCLHHLEFINQHTKNSSTISFPAHSTTRPTASILHGVIHIQGRLSSGRSWTGHEILVTFDFSCGYMAPPEQESLPSCKQLLRYATH